MQSNLEIYFPMTCNILTPGHIRCIEYLSEYGFVTIGLLTSNALKGYKKEIVPFEDRKYILDTVSLCVSNCRVVPQESLNPSANIQRFGCTALASGDGFEPKELACIKKFKLKKIDIKLRGETKKRYSSSAILTR